MTPSIEMLLQFHRKLVSHDFFTNLSHLNIIFGNAFIFDNNHSSHKEISDSSVTYFMKIKQFFLKKFYPLLRRGMRRFPPKGTAFTGTVATHFLEILTGTPHSQAPAGTDLMYNFRGCTSDQKHEKDQI